MSKQTINIGASPNDGTGTPLRTSFDYTNQNFTELYTALGGGVGLPGATTQVIFNDGGTNLAGDAGLVYNKTTDALTVAGLVTAGSATITGDLTVDTNVLKVDTTNNRVGVNTATPSYPLHVVTNSVATMFNLSNIDRTTANWVRITNPISSTDASAGLLLRPFPDSDSRQGAGIIASGGGANGVTDLALFVSSGTSTSTSFAAYGTTVVGSSVEHNWFQSAGSTAMTLNSTGLGIGVSPSVMLHVQKSQNSETTVILNNTNSGAAAAARLDLQSHASNYLTLQSYGQNYSGNVCGIAAAKLNIVVDNALTANSTGLLIGTVSTNPLYFVTANAVKMTLDASGNLLVGTTSNAPAGTQSQIVNQWSGGAKWGSTFNQTVSSATPYTHIAFCTNGTVRGSIDANNVTLTYGIVSDYRLKENVEPISNALARIAALKPSTYKWKDSGTDGEGFIAHELASVVPLAVIGQKDAVNEDGSIKAQQIDLSKVVPILVAAIQELTAEVNALKNA
jgi:hypothetical protein